MIKKKKKEEPAIVQGPITRRDFNSFFLLGSLISFLTKKTPLPSQPKEAMFWKKTDA